jgi:hypothetical protein
MAMSRLSTDAPVICRILATSADTPLRNWYVVMQVICCTNRDSPPLLLTCICSDAQTSSRTAKLPTVSLKQVQLAGWSGQILSSQGAGIH